MGNKKVLIVDDEKNIRLTLAEALEPLDLEIDTAVNGEEALKKLEEVNYDLLLLDLKMPGMDGMEVLKKVRETRPEIQLIIITAHGTIDSAVDAMKFGASDFIQKPFAPKEIRSFVSKVLDRRKIDEKKVDDYQSYIELAKKSIGERHFDSAIKFVEKALSIDPGRPETFNLLGALQEISGKRLEAQESYRAALSLDPTYQPADKNLDRLTGLSSKGKIIFDND